MLVSSTTFSPCPWSLMDLSPGTFLCTLSPSLSSQLVLVLDSSSLHLYLPGPSIIHIPLTFFHFHLCLMLTWEVVYQILLHTVLCCLLGNEEDDSRCCQMGGVNLVILHEFEDIIWQDFIVSGFSTIYLYTSSSLCKVWKASYLLFYYFKSLQSTKVDKYGFLWWHFQAWSLCHFGKVNKHVKVQ